MRHGARLGTLTAALLASGLLGGCAHEAAPQPEAVVGAPTTVPSYDAALPASAAVLPLVPEAATTLTVTDFDQVRLELGQADLGDASAQADVRAFWAQAERERPLLTAGMLRPDEAQLAAFGLSQLDVAWEAHFFGSDGSEMGWVLAMREGTDMDAVRRAVQAGVGALVGATVRPDDRLVTSGAASDPAQSWAADPTTVALVGLPGNATYVERGCDKESTGDGVDALDSYSVQFEGTLATARLGPGRLDLFARMRLAAADPRFAASYGGGVADPRTGRIGYVMSDPRGAAQLVLSHGLPFTTCG